jgi:hypothetical protein
LTMGAGRFVEGSSLIRASVFTKSLGYVTGSLDSSW